MCLDQNDYIINLISNLVKNVLEVSLIQHDLIILNTTIYCATKEPIDNQTFIHEPTTIVI